VCTYGGYCAWCTDQRLSFFFFSVRLTNRTNSLEKDQKFLETAQSNVALNDEKHFKLCVTGLILDV
jgi:hypothetical protein